MILLKMVTSPFLDNEYDESGSIAVDTIGGYIVMRDKQKLSGDFIIITVLFDNDYELLHDRIDVKSVGHTSDKEYCVGGSTALLDAIGRTFHKIGNVQKNTAEDYKAEKVMFVIITDGAENSSREYSPYLIKQMIDRQKSKYGWEFIFLGANIDAVETVEHFGINSNSAQDYHADSEGVELNFRVMSDTVASFRTKSAMPENWNREIQEDYKKRGGKH